MSNPKTLIISSYSPPSIGGPQILYNLLRDIPPNSYSILTSFYNIDNTSAEKGTWLNCEYLFYDNLSQDKGLLRKKIITDGRSFISRLKHLIKSSPFFRTLFGIPIIGGQIMMIVRAGQKQNIGKIISVSDYGPALISSYLISKKKKVSFILFLFDIYKGNHFPFPGGILAYFFEPKMIKLAQKIIVTNEGTRDFYLKRYGEKIKEKIIIIHNSTFSEPYLKLHSPYNPKPPYTILYTGRIYWPQIRSLKNLMRAIEKIKEIEIKLKIYCPNPPDYLKKIGFQETERIKIFPSLSPSEIAEVQTRADILFLPLSWKTKSPDIINTATPGKLTDYLISGRPILIHAPSSSFLVKYAKEKSFAQIVDVENSQKLKEGILKLISDQNYCHRLVKKAKETYFQNHNAYRNSLIFKKLL